MNDWDIANKLCLLSASKAYSLHMYDNKVWNLMDIPEGRKAVENKWIFKKIDADGNVTVYKARLVAKGFRQVHGIDYDEIFHRSRCLSLFGFC